MQPVLIMYACGSIYACCLCKLSAAKTLPKQKTEDNPSFLFSVQFSTNWVMHGIFNANLYRDSGTSSTIKYDDKNLAF